jgi:hypothetical protein
MKKQIENYEEILQKVKEIVPMTKSILVLGPMSAKELLELPIKNSVVELHPEDFNLPSAICVIDFDFLYDLKSFKGTNKLMVFDIYWGCVYPERQLFVLEFWEAVNTTGKIFEMYLTPQQIKCLIKILQKGLEYLKKYGKNDKKEEVETCQQ